MKYTGEYANIVEPLSFRRIIAHKKARFNQ